MDNATPTTRAPVCVSVKEEVNAMCTNKTRDHIAVVGRNVFQIYRLESDEFIEMINLRMGKSHKHLNFSSYDVAWSNADDSLLASAATNGAVLIWDLKKQLTKSKQGGVSEEAFNYHKRRVNRLTFHPTDTCLLSGSQDGIKLFDVRSREHKAFQSGGELAIRDVMFNGGRPDQFAAATENGVVQFWDVRSEKQPTSELSCHNGPVMSIDWNPGDAHILATGGRDKLIRVWNVAGASGKASQLSEYTVQTIAAVAGVRWRLGGRTWQLASICSIVDFNVSVWELGRPCIPFSLFRAHRDNVTGVIWIDANTLVSCSKDTYIVKHTFAHNALQPARLANATCVTVNLDDRLAHVSPFISTTGPASSSSTPAETQSADPTHYNTVPASASKRGVRPLLTAAPKAHSQTTITSFHPDGVAEQRFVDEKHSVLCLHPLPKAARADSGRFVALARAYRLADAPFALLCMHNADVALRLGCAEAASAWRIVQCLYPITGGSMPEVSEPGADEQPPVNPDPRPPSPAPPPAPSAPPPGQSPRRYESGQDSEDFSVRRGLLQGDSQWDAVLLRHDLFRPLFDVITGEPVSFSAQVATRLRPARSLDPDSNPGVEYSLPRRAAQSGEARVKALAARLAPATVRRPAGLDSDKIVVDLLRTFVDRNDVQTAASLLLVLGPRSPLRTLDEEHAVETWLISYIDLLKRFRLWTVACEVLNRSWHVLPILRHLINSPLHAQANEVKSLVLSCGMCNKHVPPDRPATRCSKPQCAATTVCGVCLEPVRGLLVWCARCAHGGHVEHLRQWFAAERECPTGCGCECEL